ncbi:MAG: hypothetical protein RLZZ236_1880 [Bacteroidota bacterium]
MDKLISIIVPIYNRFLHADRAIASIVNQTYSNWELFVVDDASIDTYKIPEFCNGSLKNITLLRNEKNLGPGLSRQKGKDLAKGEYICFLDSDDFWKPDFLLESLKVHEVNPDLAATYCQSEMTDGSLRRRNNIEDSVDDIFYGVVSGVRPWATCSLMWNIKYLAKWNAIRTNQDALFELETAVKNHRIKMIPLILCIIDKETGNNAQNMVGVGNGNINRTKVLLSAMKIFKFYTGNNINRIKIALWYSLYVQMKKMIKQYEMYLAARVAISLIYRIHWTFSS